MQKIPVLTIRFRNELASYEVPAFRGAVLTKVPPELTLFHNHVDDKLRYRYPLIQYKRINGKAAIVCIGEGTEEIGRFFMANDFTMHISGREEPFEVESVVANQWLLQVWESDFNYTIRKWLPLNAANYAAYCQLEGVVEKTEMLEHILTGNILSLCTGLSEHVEKQITCRILNIENERTYKYKGVSLLGLDVTFRSNISLYDFIGLGKGVSIGHGTVKRAHDRIKEKNQQNNNNHE